MDSRRWVRACCAGFALLTLVAIEGNSFAALVLPHAAWSHPLDRPYVSTPRHEMIAVVDFASAAQ